MNRSEARKQYGTYRCPVCGHRDGAEVDAGEPAAAISCPYCHTTLELRDWRGSGRFDARVSSESMRG